jgi:formimidoylglutamate deiminase
MSKNLWFHWAFLEHGWIENVRLTLDNGRISVVETGVAAEAGEDRFTYAVAGLPNVHSHTFQRAIAGLTERRGPKSDNFWTWREAMYGAVARLTPEDVEAIAAQSFMEMLESGFTHVGEFHYIHRNSDGRAYADIAEMSHRVIAAAATTGIGLTMLPCFYAHSQIGGAPPLPRQLRFVNGLDEFAEVTEACRAGTAKLDLSNTGVAPHSLRAATFEEIKAVADMARRISPDTPIHIHVAEQTKEVEDCLTLAGGRPVEILLANAPIGANWCLIHATHTTAGELGSIAARKAVIGLCPLTEANLGDGFIDARGFLGQGGKVGVGSDSNVIVDAVQELRMMEYAQRLSQRERNVVALAENSSCGEAAYTAALQGGHQALNLGIAGLAKGARADIVALRSPDDIDDPSTLLDRIIFGTRDRMIDTVWRAGKIVVRDGRHIARDGIKKSFSASMKRMTSAI